MSTKNNEPTEPTKTYPLPHLIQLALQPQELDEPSLIYLSNLIGEEADFLRQTPKSLTRAQLLTLLVEKLEDCLVTYELADDRVSARKLCNRFIGMMKKANYIQLAEEDKKEETTTASTTEDASAASSTSSSSSSSSPSSSSSLPSNNKPLSAPVRIMDLTASDSSPSGHVSQLDILKARAQSRWSPAEEVVFFQSLADTPPTVAESDNHEESAGEGECQMCRREMPLTRHHLIPRMHHKHKPWASMDQKWLMNHVILICRPCHSAVHKMEDERTLATSFNTLELIMADERMKRWCAYISKRRVNRTVAQTKNGAKLHYGR